MRELPQPDADDPQSSIDPAMSHVTFHPSRTSRSITWVPGSPMAWPKGGAVGDQFRSAPLWGVGQRLFFLHDGRTSDIVAAIEAHSSTGSEANTVITNFNTLSKPISRTSSTFCDRFERTLRSRAVQRIEV